MTILQGAILGAIEGLTEFLPISSTGHLIVASRFLAIPQDESTKAFEVIIQLAAILALFVSYKEKFSVKYLPLWSKVFLAFLPLGVVGWLFSKQIKALFSIEVVAVMFIVGGVAFLIVEQWFIKDDSKTTKNVCDITTKQALLIGFAQLFALIPGTSRAGSTIIGALLVGVDRKAAAEFSFLLALPVMLAVSIYDLLKHYKEFSNSELVALSVGFVTAFVVAYLSMKLFLSFLERFTFVAFGWYRILFGVVLLLL